MPKEGATPKMPPIFKQTQGGKVVYASGIALGSSAFGAEFQKLTKAPTPKTGAVGKDYLHISTSVVIGGYSKNIKEREGQIQKYNEIIANAAEKMKAIKTIQTGKVKKSQSGDILLKITTPDIDIQGIIAQMETEIQSTGLTCAIKSGNVHITLAKGPIANEAEWTSLENKTFALSGAVFSMLDYPPKIDTKPDVSRVVLKGPPLCAFGSSPQPAESVKPKLNAPPKVTQDIITDYNASFKDSVTNTYTPGYAEPKPAQFNGQPCTEFTFPSEEEAKNFFIDQASKGRNFIVIDQAGNTLYTAKSGKLYDKTHKEVKEEQAALTPQQNSAAQPPLTTPKSGEAPGSEPPAEETQSPKPPTEEPQGPGP